MISLDEGKASPSPEATAGLVLILLPVQSMMIPTLPGSVLQNSRPIWGEALAGILFHPKFNSVPNGIPLLEGQCLLTFLFF